MAGPGGADEAGEAPPARVPGRGRNLKELSFDDLDDSRAAGRGGSDAGASLPPAAKGGRAPDRGPSDPPANEPELMEVPAPGPSVDDEDFDFTARDPKRKELRDLRVDGSPVAALELGEDAERSAREAASEEARRREEAAEDQRARREAIEADAKEQSRSSRSPREDGGKRRQRDPLTGLEKALLSLSLLAVVGGLVVVANLMLKASSSQGGVGGGSEAGALKVPLEGELVTITEVDLAWRDRRPADRGNREAIRLPDVRITLARSGSPAYLQVIFRNDEGRIKGDAFTLKLENGSFTESGGRSLLLSGTDGFLNPAMFLEYRSDDSRHWTIELLESDDYRASAEEWASLGRFRFPTRYVPEGLPTRG